MNTQGLRTTVYKVPNLTEAKNWYAKAFGIEPYFNESFYVGFNIGGYELGLLPIEGENIIGNNTISYWGVENINEVFKEFIANGATVYEEPQNVGGELMVAAVKDPWGNIIGLIYNPDFKIL